MNIINFPEAISIESFAKGNVEMIEIYVSEHSSLVGTKLSSLYEKFDCSFAFLFDVRYVGIDFVKCVCFRRGEKFCGTICPGFD